MFSMSHLSFRSTVALLLSIPFPFSFFITEIKNQDSNLTQVCSQSNHAVVLRTISQLYHDKKLVLIPMGIFVPEKIVSSANLFLSHGLFIIKRKKNMIALCFVIVLIKCPLWGLQNFLA